MSKKQDAMYFDNFIACAGYASQAAQLLKEIFRNFDPAQMPAWMDQIHAIEHSADKKRHSMTDQLAHAFITPIEREDISALSARIDTLTDKLEEVCIRVYMHNVQTIHPGALNMLDVVIRACDQVCRLLEEFADFKHSKSSRRTSSGSIPWKKSVTVSTSPTCGISTSTRWTLPRSSPGARSTPTWKSAPTPARPSPTASNTWS